MYFVLTKFWELFSTTWYAMKSLPWICGQNRKVLMKLQILYLPWQFNKNLQSFFTNQPENFKTKFPHEFQHSLPQSYLPWPNILSTLSYWALLSWLEKVCSSSPVYCTEVGMVEIYVNYETKGLFGCNISYNFHKCLIWWKKHLCLQWNH